MGDYQHVSFKHTGRYAVLGSLNTSTKTVLIAFHGQGQLAKYYIQKFKGLQKLGITVIAPEGLHNYYLQGFSGRVGALWMTSENRLMAIENYLSFLNSVYNEVILKTSDAVKIHILGFSQGTATASRWVENTTFNFERLILWGGTLPPDLDKNLMNNRMQDKLLLQVIGENDPFIDLEKIEELKLLVENYGLAAKYIFYNGAHDIDSSVFLKLFNKN